ncbi:MAG: hypothetical protein AB1760_18725 [Pseudomonadota bacterium]
MKNFLETHQKTATAGAIVVAVAVVALLWYLSTLPPSTSGDEPVFAHSPSGPVQLNPSGSGPAAPADITEVDFPQYLSPEIEEGRELREVLYVDIDADGAKEAVATLKGSGENEPLDWFLYKVSEGEIRLIFEHRGVARGQVAVDGPRIVETEAVYAEGDEACCPSSQKRTIYVWKGGTLVVSRVEAAPPSGSAP